MNIIFYPKKWDDIQGPLVNMQRDWDFKKIFKIVKILFVMQNSKQTQKRE